MLKNSPGSLASQNTFHYLTSSLIQLHVVIFFAPSIKAVWILHKLQSRNPNKYLPFDLNVLLTDMTTICNGLRNRTINCHQLLLSTIAAHLGFPAGNVSKQMATYWPTLIPGHSWQCERKTIYRSMCHRSYGHVCSLGQERWKFGRRKSEDQCANYQCKKGIPLLLMLHLYFSACP